MLSVDGSVKSRNCSCFVIPVQAGMQYYQIVVDSAKASLRAPAGNDIYGDFLRDRHCSTFNKPIAD